MRFNEFCGHATHDQEHQQFCINDVAVCRLQSIHKREIRSVTATILSSAYRIRRRFARQPA